MSNKAAAILAAAAILVGALIGRASASGGAPPPEATPITGQSLDPTAYPRTKEGAATAAQAYDDAGIRAGFMSAEERRAVIDAISNDAMREEIAKESDQAAAVFAKLFDLPSGEDQIVRRMAPLGWRILSFTNDSARVELWTVSVFGKRGVGNGIAPVFKTATLDLSWERDAWRLAGLPQSKDGPTPAADNAAASSTIAAAVEDLQEFSHVAR